MDDNIKIRAQSLVKCQKCGKCCKLAPHVLLMERDIINLANRFHITPQKALKKYAIYVPEFDQYSIKYTKPCMFFKEGVGCTIYRFRPQVCKDYPFGHQIGSNEPINMYNCSAAEDVLVELIAEQHLKRKPLKNTDRII